MKIVTSTPRGDIVWTRHDLPEAALSFRGHLRFLQGAPLRDLFLPLILVRGTPNHIWRIPFKLSDVTLAEIHEAPEGLPVEQIALELLKVVLVPTRAA